MVLFYRGDEMSKILLAGFEKMSIIDEVINRDENLDLIFSDTYSHTLEVLNHHVKTAIIHENYYVQYEKEFKEFIQSHDAIQYFVIVDSDSPNYVEQFHDEDYAIYSLKTDHINFDFLKNIICFSKELEENYTFKELTINYRTKEVTLHGKTLIMTPMEFDLLVYMKIHAGLTLSRDDLIRAVWGYSFLGDSRTIDTHIKSLRHKLGSYRCIIKTVWGKGYKYQEC